MVSASVGELVEAVLPDEKGSHLSPFETLNSRIIIDCMHHVRGVGPVPNANKGLVVMANGAAHNYGEKERQQWPPP
jgi:hypothetical protein